MILHCSFEELSALDAGSRNIVTRASANQRAVSAPPQVLADIEALIPRLTGDVSVNTLQEQRSLQRAMEYVLHDLRRRADAAILDQHPAAESAVQAYFEFAHVLVLVDRIRRLGDEMAAIIEVTTGTTPDEETASRFAFPD